MLLFAALAVLIACLLHGRLATVGMLLLGGALMGLAWPVNLHRLGNALAWWLDISPYQ